MYSPRAHPGHCTCHNRVDNAEPCYPHDNIVGGHLCDEGMNLAKPLSPLLVQVVTDRASWFTDHGMSGLPIRAKYKHLKTMCEHTFDNSPTDSSSSFLT